MRLLCWAVVLTALLVVSADAKRKRKFEGDFEFAEEDESKSTKKGDKKRWIHDPKSDLCGPLNCKKKELCLLEDAFTAACVNKKELQRNGDIVIPKSAYKDDFKVNPTSESTNEGDDDVFYDSEDDDSDDEDDFEPETRCKPCPIVKPSFHCGADNRTYSSLCRLDYHNCIHKTSIRVACKGFCPCSKTPEDPHRKQKEDRLAAYNAKLKATLKKSNKPMSSSSYSDKYNYIPQDFKYDNKHYKYIKYTKYSNGVTNSPYNVDKHRSHNEVIETKNKFGAKGTPNWNKVIPECSPTALEAMGNRLLDWFSVLMADAKKDRHTGKRRKLVKSTARFPGTCKPEVRWMFAHLDSNSDEQLSVTELFDLEHDKSEHCIKPFLDQCNVDKNGFVSPKEWCRCFERSERPCIAYKQRITQDLLGSYVPECDALGFYRPTQCHSSIGTCWCVDKHGVEFANTRTRGKPDCVSIMAKNNSNGGSDDSDQEDYGDDLEEEGSAEKPLDF
ncbi:proteoglycan Cow [Neocloeon triangulifer]|uniref:proteoglycan Cow n=1 Tax=Neocloeon triangulifer TaxID=2078957 RepID=UPI00286EE1CD|nr:proteoglycan Cow [Neocloeon triangulifer]